MAADAAEVPGAGGAGAASCLSRNGTDALGVGGAGAPSSGGEDRNGPDGPDRATQSSTRAGDEGEGHVTPIGEAEEHEAVTPVGEAEGCESKVAEVVGAAGADVSASGCKGGARSSVVDWDTAVVGSAER